MKKLKRLSTLITWTCLSIYTFTTIALTDTVFMTSHYMNFLFLGITLTIYLINNAYGHLATIITLILCFFTGASFTPTTYYFNIGKLSGSHLSLSYTYIPLIIYFIIINIKETPDWFANELNKSKVSLTNKENNSGEQHSS